MLAEQPYPQQLAEDMFAALVDQYSGSMRAVGYQVLGDRQMAEDVAQETFLRAYVNRSALDDHSNIGGWLYTIAYRISIDNRRKRSRVLLPFSETIHLQDDTTPEDTAIRNEAFDHLWQAVNSVDETYRLPLILFYKHDWPLQKIADHLSLTVPAVKSRLHRSKKVLRAKLLHVVE